jgi:hypothetical protein
VHALLSPLKVLKYMCLGDAGAQTTMISHHVAESAGLQREDLVGSMLQDALLIGLILLSLQAACPDNTCRK